MERYAFLFRSNSLPNLSPARVTKNTLMMFTHDDIIFSIQTLLKMFNTVTRDAAECLAEEAGDALDTVEALEFIID